MASPLIVLAAAHGCDPGDSFLVVCHSASQRSMPRCCTKVTAFLLQKVLLTRSVILDDIRDPAAGRIMGTAYVSAGFGDIFYPSPRGD